MQSSESNNIPTPGESQESSAEPHPKDGHLRMPNTVVERLAKLHLNGTQWQVLWAVWRKTLCWQQQGQWRNRPQPISIDDLVALTGINEHQLKRELGHLIEMNIILRDKILGGRKHKALTAFNLDPSTWEVPQKSSEIATLSQRVAEKHPFATQKGSEIATQIKTEDEEKGSGLVPPSVADSLPFTDKSATLSQAKSKLLNKPLKKPFKEEVVPTPDELKILNILKGLKGWRYDEADDVTWLRDFSQEFPDFGLVHLRAGRDYYSGWPVPKHKGGWKNRFRNWMLKKQEFERMEKPGPRGKSFEQYMKEQQEGS